MRLKNHLIKIKIISTSKYIFKKNRTRKSKGFDLIPRVAAKHTRTNKTNKQTKNPSRWCHSPLSIITPFLVYARLCPRILKSVRDKSDIKFYSDLHYKLSWKQGRLRGLQSQLGGTWELEGPYTQWRHLDQTTRAQEVRYRASEGLSESLCHVQEVLLRNTVFTVCQVLWPPFRQCSDSFCHVGINIPITQMRRQAENVLEN